MTDQQLLTIAIAIVFPLSMLLYSNSRIGDVGKRIDDSKETLRAEIAELRAEMRAGFERIELLLKMHEVEHHK
jgi:hypothetical protein